MAEIMSLSFINTNSPERYCIESGENDQLKQNKRNEEKREKREEKVVGSLCGVTVINGVVIVIILQARRVWRLIQTIRKEAGHWRLDQGRKDGLGRPPCAHIEEDDLALHLRLPLTLLWLGVTEGDIRGDLRMEDVTVILQRR